MKQLLFAVSFLLALSVEARVFMTQQQALASVFPAGSSVRRQSVFLTQQQASAAASESGVRFDDRLVVRYVGVAGGKVTGYAYFDTHRVRTLPETVMIVVSPEGKVERIEILSFDEPPDYFPRPKWIDQLRGRKLDNDLSLNRAIRPLSGASLTGRAIVNSSRKILALHHVIGVAAP